MQVFRVKHLHNECTANLYFSCNPKDFDLYFETLTSEILEVASNCNIYYLDEKNTAASDIEQNDYFSNFNNINLFVFPISYRFLTKKSVARDIDLPYAIDNHFPILPIIVEPGIGDVFDKRYTKMQVIDKTVDNENNDPYKVKLAKFLKSVLVSRENYERAVSAFDSHIYLSYHMLDRRYLTEVMKTIHADDFMRDIGIWYNDNLCQESGLDSSLKRKIEKCDLFAITLTPNTYAEGSRILTYEYPTALENNKKMVMFEAVKTNRVKLESSFKEVPEVINIKIAKKVSSRLRSIFIKEGLISNNTPDHLFNVGEAYLNGIDVERDPKKGINYIELAARENYLPALYELVDIYRSGRNIKVDYKKAIYYTRILLQKVKSIDSSYDEILMLLAELYFKNKDYRSAIKVAKKVFSIRSNKAGEISEEALEVLDFIASAYARMGRYKNAITINEKCYSLRKTKYGDKDQNTLMSLYNLASNYRHLGVHEKSKELDEKIYKILASAFDDHYPQTMRSLSNLAKDYSNLKDYETAKELNEKCYELRKEVLGQTHPETLMSLSAIANNYSSMGNFHKSIELNELIYGILVDIFDEQYPLALDSINNVANDYIKLSEYTKSSELYEKCYELRKEVLGQTHPDTLSALKSLAYSYSYLGEKDKSKEMFKEYRKLYSKSLVNDNNKIYRLLIVIGLLILAYIFLAMFSFNLLKFFNNIFK